MSFHLFHFPRIRLFQFYRTEHFNGLTYLPPRRLSLFLYASAAN